MRIVSAVSVALGLCGALSLLHATAVAATDSIPNLTGNWRHQSLPGIEPMASTGHGATA